MATTISDVLLGYGGGAKIDGTNVLITGGSLSSSMTVPLITALKSPIGASNVYNVVTGSALYTFTGSVNFDFTIPAVNGFITNTFLKRNHEFNINISDGHKHYKMEKCKWSSFSVNASPGSLVSGSISFTATNGTYTVLQDGVAPDYIFNDSNPLLSYWYTGETEVESFTLSLSQSLTPVFLNGNQTNACYIRAGVLDASLQVSSWESWLTHTSIKIASKTVAFSKNYMESKGFSYGGATATGTHSYTVKVAAESNADEEVLSIT